MSADDKINLYNLSQQKIINIGNLGSSYTTLESLSTYLKNTYGNNFVVFFEAQNFTDGTPSGFFIALYNSAVSLYVRYIFTNKRHDEGTGIINLGEIENFKYTKPTNANDTSIWGYCSVVQDTYCSNLPTSGTGQYYAVLFLKSIQYASRYNGSGSPITYMRYYTNSQWYPWRPIGGNFITIYNSSGIQNATITLSEAWTNFRKLYFRTYTNQDYFVTIIPCTSIMLQNRIEHFSFANPSNFSGSGLTSSPFCGSVMTIGVLNDKTKLEIKEFHNNENWTQKLISVWGEY